MRNINIMSFELVLIGNMSFSVSALKVLFIFCGFQNFNLAISWYGLLVYLIWIYSSSWFFFLCLSCEVFDHYFLNYFSPTLFLIFCNSYGNIVGYCHFSLRFLRFWGFFVCFPISFLSPVCIRWIIFLCP